MTSSALAEEPLLSFVAGMCNFIHPHSLLERGGLWSSGTDEKTETWGGLTAGGSRARIQTEPVISALHSVDPGGPSHHLQASWGRT